MLSFCCSSHVGRFGKETLWDEDFELLLFGILEDLEGNVLGSRLLLLLALVECWKIWNGNDLGCRS